jgi:circadian clock protein KaiB
MTRKHTTPGGPARRRAQRARPGSRSGRVITLDSRSAKPKAKRPPDRYVLRLYVTGVARASAQAVERVRALCEDHLHGRYELEVIDIYQLPALAKGEQIVATPTLIRVLPEPLRRYIGDLSNEKIVFGLDLREKR